MLHVLINNSQDISKKQEPQTSTVLYFIYNEASLFNFSAVGFNVSLIHLLIIMWNWKLSKVQTVVVSGGCFTFDHSFTVREEEKEEIHWLGNKNIFFFAQTNLQVTLVGNPT